MIKLLIILEPIASRHTHAGYLQVAVKSASVNITQLPYRSLLDIAGDDPLNLKIREMEVTDSSSQYRLATLQCRVWSGTRPGQWSCVCALRGAIVQY